MIKGRYVATVEIDFLIKSVTESTVTNIEPENGVLKVWIS